MQAQLEEKLYTGYINKKVRGIEEVSAVANFIFLDMAIIFM